MHLFSCPHIVVAADHSGHNPPKGTGGKKPGKLSRRGRTLCAPTEHDVLLSSGRISCAHRTGPGTIKTTRKALRAMARVVTGHYGRLHITS